MFRCHKQRVCFPQGSLILGCSLLKHSFPRMHPMNIGMPYEAGFFAIQLLRAFQHFSGEIVYQGNFLPGSCFIWFLLSQHCQMPMESNMQFGLQSPGSSDLSLLRFTVFWLMILPYVFGRATKVYHAAPGKHNFVLCLQFRLLKLGEV